MIRFTTSFTLTYIDYRLYALLTGKPTKAQPGRSARDFRAARRRHQRWTKGKP